jgi:hypothetical protein
VIGPGKFDKLRSVDATGQLASLLNRDHQITGPVEDQRWNADGIALTPRGASIFVDRGYLFFAAGLLRGIADDLAIRLLKGTLVPVG